MFPGHNSAKPKRATKRDGVSFTANATSTKLEATSGVSDLGVEDNSEPRDVLGQSQHTGTLKGGISPTDDEYGAELGADARFWKTYVDETDRWDAEMIDGWNKSLDVILVFAALFSAISTAFVIESSKNLQPDPSEASAQTLLLISQTLLVMSGNNLSALPVPTTPGDVEFVPSASAICVNVLWFASLSLSVAVSLVAMLAKEWCYTYMAGRTGHPCQQARRRQQRWDGIEDWKMKGIVMFLPSLMHLALLLFAIGLSIYLWSIHFGVAIPVIVVTGVSFSLYAISTILPLRREFCPYSTTLSRLLQQGFQTFFPGIHSSTPDEIPRQDGVTSRALGWLIVNCEVPTSVNTALQAIAGAAEGLDKTPLKDCEAAARICRRLIASSSYVGDYQLTISRYTRALAFLQPNDQISARAEDKPTDKATGGGLEVGVWDLQSKNEQAVASHLVDGKFKPTTANLSALRIGSTAASHCLKMFHNSQGDNTLVELAISLLEKYVESEISLHPAALLALVKAAAMLFSCAPPISEAPQQSVYLTRLVRALFSRENYSPQSAHIVGVILSAYALSQRDSRGWKQSPPLSPESRAVRAMVMVEHCMTLEKITGNTASAPLMFGLLELVRYCRPDGATNGDYTTLVTASESMLRKSKGVPTGYIYTMPNYVLDQHILDILDPVMLSALGPPQAGAVQNRAQVEMCLRLLRSRPPASPNIQIYSFIVESLCRIDSVELKQACTELLMIYDRQSLPEVDLDGNFSTRGVPVLLFHTVVNLSSHDYRTVLFAMSQLWQYVTRAQRLSSDLELQVEEIYHNRCSLLEDSENTVVYPPIKDEKVFQIQLLGIFLSILKDAPVSTYTDIKESKILGLIGKACPDSNITRSKYVFTFK